MALVELRPNETLDDALRRFRKVTEREGLSKEIKKRVVYEKPSLVRKRKKEVRKRKLLRKLRKVESRVSSHYSS